MTLASRACCSARARCGFTPMAISPAISLAAHLRQEDVASAEVIGVGGVEKAFDHWLRDPANDGAPLVLSLDLTVQAAMEEVLSNGMKVMNPPRARPAS